MSTPSNACVGAFADASFDAAAFDPDRFGLSTDVADSERYERSVQRFRDQGIALPTFAQLADPSTIPDAARSSLTGVDRNAADARNLYRCHPGTLARLETP